MKWRVLLRFLTLLLFGVVIFLLGVQTGSKNPSLSTELFMGGNLLNTTTLPGYLSKDVNFGLFWEVRDLIQEKFVDSPVPDTQLFYGSLSGMVSSLKDDYSTFMTPTDSKAFDQALDGKFEGIGAEIGIKNERLLIISPLPNSPAERAGLEPRDWIIAIDGLTSQGLPLDEAVRKIRGKKGTVVKLEIIRGTAKPKTFEIVRDTIVIREVKLTYSQTTSGKKVARVQLLSFNKNALAELQQAAQEIVTGGVEGIVFDMRNNPGGLLDQAVEVAGLWVPAGNVVVWEAFSGGEKRALTTEGMGLFERIPTVVLINGGSASASEIVAGALQDYGIATVVGEKSFGKGSVQSYDKLSDGSALKLTVAKWLTPKQRVIEKDGISPDIEVKLSEEDFAADRDPQLDKALEVLDGKIGR